MKQDRLWMVLAMTLFFASPAFAQTAGNILNSLPPELYKKLEQLSQMLDQQIKAGRLTDAQVHQELMSGRLEQTIRGLGPEANQLFEDIQSDLRSGNGPGEDALLPLLGGLSAK